MKPDWHLLRTEAVLEKLGTGKNGLSSTEAKDRLAKYGQNLLKEAPKKSPFLLFLKQFIDVLVLILIAAAVISAFTGDVTDTIVIIFIVFSAGEKVSADLRLIESYNLNVEEAALTGESLPVEKSSEPLQGTVSLA